MDWNELNSEILSRLDIATECEQLGVKFSKSNPNDGGWLECHAIGREDKSASAAVCVSGDNGTRGKYKDLGSGEKAISFFELAAKLGPFPDWLAARQHYATQAGVEIPSGAGPAYDQVEWLSWRASSVDAWCKHHKQGVTREILEAAGAKLCKWPKRSASDFHCIAIPGYRDSDSTPCSWSLYRIDGQQFPAVDGKKVKLKERKVHNLRASRSGWVCAGGLAAITAAKVIWKCEGQPDALTLQACLPEGHLAITGTNGANESPSHLPLELLAGKTVYVVPDADEGGMAGGQEFAEAIAAAGAADVRIVPMPYPVEKKHGKDLRDWFNEGATFAQLATRAEFADKVSPPETDPTIANYIEEFVEGEKPRRVAVNLPEIAVKIHQTRGKWPRSLGGLIMLPGTPSDRVPDDDAIRFAKTDADLFSWLREKSHINWAGTCHDHSPPSRAELFSYLGNHSTHRYEGVNYLPHYPMAPDMYYVPCDLPDPNGETLEEYLDHLNPETEQDRWMMLAALLTPGWGGPPGQRPAFLFTSTHGRGAGKSKTAEAIADVWGGAITTTFARRSLDDFRSRLLDDAGLKRRVVLVDNIKGTASSAEIEGMITTKVLDGKRMYFGDYRRVNNLTWFFTANTPSLSKDLTDRSVIVRIGKPRSEPFDDWLNDWLKEKRLNLIADLLQILQGEDKCTIDAENRDRWGAWRCGVLQKIKVGNELAALIKELRPSVDADTDEADQVAEHIASFIGKCKLSNSNFDPERCYIAIPNATVYAVLRGLWSDTKMSDKVIRQRLNDLIGCGKLSCMQPNPSRKHGRTMVWTGPEANESQILAYPWSTEWLMEYQLEFESATTGEESRSLFQERKF